MSVTVYIWDHDREDHWGHCSLLVTGGPYISWWPSLVDNRVYTVDKIEHPVAAQALAAIIGTSNVYKVKHCNNTNLQSDIEAEGNTNPKYKAVFADNVLDEKAIQRWWTGYAVADASYHSIKKNCSTTVLRALQAGGSDELMDLARVKLAEKIAGKYFGWEPNDILSYLKRLEQSIGAEKLTIEDSFALDPLELEYDEEMEEWDQVEPRGRAALAAPQVLAPPPPVLEAPAEIPEVQAPDLPDVVNRDRGKGVVRRPSVATTPRVIAARQEVEKLREDYSDEMIEMMGMWPDILRDPITKRRLAF